MKKFFSWTLAAGIVMTGSVAQAVTIDKFLLLNPIQVCNDAGANCASAPLSEAKTKEIYEQAGVAAVYLPTTQLNNSSLLTTDGVNDVNKVGNGQSTNANTVNVWFVDSLNADPGFTLFGEAYIGGNGAVINSSAVDAASRTDTVAHEVGHNLGLGHTDFGAGGANNVLTRGSDRDAPASELTAEQIAQIRSSTFTQDNPEVTVDLRGSTPFQTDNFFDLSFATGPAGVSLSKFTIDLSPANAFFDPTNSPPGIDGSGLGTSGLTGIGLGDLTFSGLTDGSQNLEVSFAAGTFTVGDSFAFGSDIDLFSAIDGFGATPDELVGINFGFEYNIGLEVKTALDSDLITGTQDPTDFLSLLGTPVPFGPQVTQGQLPPGSTLPVAGVPVPIQPIPEPASVWLLLSGLGMLAGRAWWKK